MEKEAVYLELLEGTTIRVSFIDGVSKTYDVLSLADKFPQLLALKDRDLFLKGRLIGWSGVIWNDELDVDAETIYEEGRASEAPKNIAGIILGYKIKKYRLKKEMSQEELAVATGITQADISRLEKGKSNPSVETLKRVSNALDCKLIIDLK